MKDESANPGGPATGAASAPDLPAAVDRATFQAELDRLRVREKAHTGEGDAIAAARRRLPMVEVEASLALTGPQGPYDESSRYRDFMGWDTPWYSAHASLDALLTRRQIGLFHLVCYLRDGDRVFETYWTSRRGAEAMDYSYALMDLTVYGRQEPWEDSPPGWPQRCSITRTSGGLPAWSPVSAWPGGRPIAQWPRLEAGRSDDLAVGP
jgi:predicted dithiol-disulfide oxidoreductase (DUF899 family)